METPSTPEATADSVNETAGDASPAPNDTEPAATPNVIVLGGGDPEETPAPPTPRSPDGESESAGDDRPSTHIESPPAGGEQQRADHDEEPRRRLTDKYPRSGAAERQSIPVGDFDEFYGRFKKGALAHARIFDLLECAQRLGKTAEMKEILSFNPENMDEEIRRKYYLAEYYLDTNSPLAALIILRTIHVAGLSRKRRSKFLLKIAYCYQALHQFDAAHSVYLRILSEDPDFADAERLARLNYGRYLAYLSGGVPVLEKVTLL